MNEKPFNVGLIGLGTVGVGVATILLHNARNIAQRAACPVILKRAADLDITSDRGLDLSPVDLTTDAINLLQDPDIDLVVEVIGGVNPARKFILEALNNRKHVVTSNKEVIAKHGPEFLDAARKSGVNIYYEAAVGGGIPILHGLKNCLAANNLKHIFGIINGTTNFILTKMDEEGTPFDEVLAEAQANGFAEADPSADVDGYDVAYKLSILAGLAFNSAFSYEDIYFEGIRHLTPQDFAAAADLGYKIKFLAFGIEHHHGKVELRVHPTMIDADHPLANVNGSFNAVFVRGNYIDEAMFYGHGAGRLPTASAVVGDILDAAMAREMTRSHPSMTTNFAPKEVLPIGETMTQYYLRLRVRDEPGVLAAVSQLTGQHHLSIRTVQQQPLSPDEAQVTLITHLAKEAHLQGALTAIRELPAVKAVETLIRVGL